MTTTEEIMLIEELERFVSESDTDKYTGSVAWQTVRSMDHYQPVPGLPLTVKGISPCTKFLLSVVIPISAVLLTMVAAKLLVQFFGFYIDVLRPFWLAGFDETGYFVGIVIPAGLFALYRICRREHEWDGSV